MARFAIDEAAWNNRWTLRPAGDKAVLAFGLSGVAMVSHSATVLVSVMVVAFCALVVGARIPATTALRVWALPAAFVVIGLVGILVTVGHPPVDPVWRAGWLSVGRSSLERATEVGLRSAAATASVLVLALTTPMDDILAVLRRLRVPAFAVEIAGVVYRMVFMLMDSQAVIRESQTARLGYVDRRRAIRSLGSLFASVLIRAWTRAQRLESGMQGRGYAGDLVVTRPERASSWGFRSGCWGTVAALAAWAVLAS